MNWERPILTDSGGFQVMSLAELRKLSEEGVSFRSHVDGAMHHLSPERSMEIQRLLGSDIVMCFDECPALPASEAAVAASMRLSMRWAARSREAFGDRPGHALFGIVQGGVTRELRGGVGGGAEGDRVRRLRDRRACRRRGAGGDVRGARLSARRRCRRTGRGISWGWASPTTSWGRVLRGVDMFDCVLPTRSGRTGQAFTRRGVVNLRNARHAEDRRPLDPDCGCPCCRGYERAYLHHVFKAGEIIAAMLLTWHNLHYYQELMAGLRAAIAAGRLAGFVAEFEALRAEGDLEPI